MRLTRKQKNILSTILWAFLCLVILLGIFGIANSVVKKNNKDDMVKVKLDWNIGSLTSYGKYQESNKSIYTKEPFKCLDLEVLLDFDSNVNYQVFYYDDLDNFISSSTIFNNSQDLDVPIKAVKARLVVTPVWGNDVEEKDRVIKWYSVRKYSKQLTVKVSSYELGANEVAVGVWKIDIRERTDNTVFFDIPVLYTNFNDTNSYRLYLKDNTSTSGYYRFIDSALPNEDDLDDDYDKVLVCYKSCADTGSFEVIKMLCNSRKLNDYYVKIDVSQDGTKKTIYLSQNLDALTNVLNSLI